MKITEGINRENQQQDQLSMNLNGDCGDGQLDATARTDAQRQRLHNTWNWYFIVEAGCVVGANCFFSTASMTYKLISSFLILLPCLFFMILVLPRVYDKSERFDRQTADQPVSKTGAYGWIFALLTLVCLPMGAWLDGTAILAQLFIVPQLFIAFSYLPALGLVGVLNIAYLAMVLAGKRFLSTDLTGNLMLMILVVVFSAMIGKSFNVLALTNGHNQMLLDKMESQQETIRRLSRAEGASIERERVANEMHDTIAQSLTSILALARVAHEELIDDIPAAQKHLEMIASTSKGSLDDTRRMIADSAPADLDGRDLKTALERTVHATAAKTGFQLQCRIQRTLPPLPKQTEVNLLRIVQESLTNISKHANAQHVQVSLLLKRPELLELQIKDDGCGFDIQNLDFQEMEKAGHGYGLRDMAKRAQDAGGRCTVTSVPGQGTSITVNIPVERPSNTTQPDKEER